MDHSHKLVSPTTNNYCGFNPHHQPSFPTGGTQRRRRQRGGCSINNVVNNVVNAAATSRQRYHSLQNVCTHSPTSTRALVPPGADKQTVALAHCASQHRRQQQQHLRHLQHFANEVVNGVCSSINAINIHPFTRVGFNRSRPAGLASAAAGCEAEFSYRCGLWSTTEWSEDSALEPPSTTLGEPSRKVLSHN